MTIGAASKNTDPGGWSFNLDKTPGLSMLARDIFSESWAKRSTLHIEVAFVDIHIRVVEAIANGDAIDLGKATLVVKGTDGEAVSYYATVGVEPSGLAELAMLIPGGQVLALAKTLAMSRTTRRLLKAGGDHSAGGRRRQEKLRGLQEPRP